MALSGHSSVFNGIVNKPPTHEAYTVTFTEQHSFHSLDKCEDKCYHQLEAQFKFKK